MARKNVKRSESRRPRKFKGITRIYSPGRQKLKSNKSRISQIQVTNNLDDESEVIPGERATHALTYAGRDRIRSSITIRAAHGI